MIPKVVKKHICEELAHGKPIQLILSPPVPPKKEKGGKIVRDDEGNPLPDPDWVKPDLPDWNSVVQWLKDDEVFRADYEHAMKYGAAYLADEMLVLKDRLLNDPKSAPAFKAAMDMIKWATMIRDPKYSERTIQEIKNNQPQDAEVVNARIKQLEDELGIHGAVIEMGPVAVIAKKETPQHVIERMQKARAALKLNREKRANPTPKTPEA